MIKKELTDQCTFEAEKIEVRDLTIAVILTVVALATLSCVLIGVVIYFGVKIAK